MAMYDVTPNKANLIKLKDSLKFSKKGYELLEKKRMVLINEMMSLVEETKDLQQSIESIFTEAYKSLDLASITMGQHNVSIASNFLEVEKDYDLLLKSVMGAEIPKVSTAPQETKAKYSFLKTNIMFDKAVVSFSNVKLLIYQLAEIENTVYRLAHEIKKTQKRLNALDKIQNKRFETAIHNITNVLEEKEKEDFVKLKILKKKKSRK